jgi:hypothetical protein
VLLVLLLLVGAGLVVALVRAGDRPARAAVATAVVAVPHAVLTDGAPDLPVDVPAAERLRDWDAQRAAAYAAGSMRMLRDLYVPGSRAGRADVRLLRAWTARGLRPEGLRTQVLGLQVVSQHPDRLVLRVTDRLAAGEAVGRAGRTPLPRDRADTRLLTLDRGSDGAWRMGEVRPAGRAVR